VAADQEVVVRVRLADVRQFLANAQAESKAIRDIGAATGQTGVAMDKTTRRGFLMNQMLFTARRYLYAGTLAATAFAGVMTKMGLSFNMQMESSEAFFRVFLGSEQAARKELALLFEVAKKTPFEFPGLVDAARKFLAFGFTVQETNDILRTVGDTIAALGLGQEGIDRIVLAIGQMRAAGRVLGGEIRQLTELGVPALQILQEELGLTSEELGRIGELRIPAAVAIPALMAGLDKRFKGMAADQAKTLMGQLTTLRDNAAQMFGALTLPLFHKLRDEVVPSLNELAEEMVEAAQTSGTFAAIDVLDRRLKAGGQISQSLKTLSFLLHDLWILAQQFFKSLFRLYALFGGLIGPLFAVRLLLKSIVSMGPVLANALALWVFWWSALKTIQIANAIWLARLIVLKKAWPLVVATGMAAERLWILWQTRGLVVAKARVLWTMRLMLSYRALRTSFVAAAMAEVYWSVRMKVAFIAQAVATRGAALAMWSLNTAMLANPLVALATAIALVAALFVTLMIRSERFREAILGAFKAVYTFFRTHWQTIGLLLLGPFGAIIVIYRNLDRLWDLAKRFYNWLKNHVFKFEFDWPDDPTDGLWAFKPWTWNWGRLNPAGAEGGTITSGGNILVGERGPEIVNLPNAATITPLTRELSLPGEPMSITVRVPIHLDGREIAEVVSRHRLTAKARR
jgi:tape measure domain-containing protein